MFRLTLPALTDGKQTFQCVLIVGAGVLFSVAFSYLYMAPIVNCNFKDFIAHFLFKNSLSV
jgi:molybdopterin/thiamine biosynthesis adenylyltransferase